MRVVRQDGLQFTCIGATVANTGRLANEPQMAVTDVVCDSASMLAHETAMTYMIYVDDGPPIREFEATCKQSTGGYVLVLKSRIRRRPDPNAMP